MLLPKITSNLDFYKCLNFRGKISIDEDLLLSPTNVMKWKKFFIHEEHYRRYYSITFSINVDGVFPDAL